MNAVDKTNYSMPEIVYRSGTITGESGVTLDGSCYVKQYGNVITGSFYGTFTLGFTPPDDAFVQIASIANVDFPEKDIDFAAAVDGSVNECPVGQISAGGGIYAYIKEGQTNGIIRFAFSYIA